MNDDELKELFSALDEVSAPDSMKASALEFIMAAPAMGVSAAATDTASGVEAVSAEKPQFTATRSKKRSKSKWRAVRVAAVAACLALALTGGAAYAIPVSVVTITQGETTIELSANVLGMVIGNSNNDAGRQILDSVNVGGMSLDESIAAITGTLADLDDQTTITVVKKINGGLETLRTDGRQSVSKAVVDDSPNEDRVAEEVSSPAPAEEAQDVEAPIDYVPSSVSGFNRADSSDAGNAYSAKATDGSQQPEENTGDDPVDDSGDVHEDDPTSDDPSENPGENPADNPGDTPADNPGDNPSDNPTDDPGDNPVDDPGDNPSDEPVDEPEPDDPALDDQGDEEDDDSTQPPQHYDNQGD